MASARTTNQGQVSHNSQCCSRLHPESSKKRERRPRMEFGPEYWMSLLESPTLSDQEKLLVNLKEVECLPWKEIQIRFNMKYGTNIEKSALQMRKSRVPAKVHRALIRQNFAEMKCSLEKVDSGNFQMANSNTHLQSTQPKYMIERPVQPSLCPQTWLEVDSSNYYDQRATTTYPMGPDSSISVSSSSSTWQPPNFHLYDQYQPELENYFSSSNLIYDSSCGPNCLPEWRVD